MPDFFFVSSSKHYSVDPWQCRPHWGDVSNVREGFSPLLNEGWGGQTSSNFQVCPKLKFRESLKTSFPTQVSFPFVHTIP